MRDKSILFLLLLNFERKHEKAQKMSASRTVKDLKTYLINVNENVNHKRNNIAASLFGASALFDMRCATVCRHWSATASTATSREIPRAVCAEERNRS